MRCFMGMVKRDPVWGLAISLIAISILIVQYPVSPEALHLCGAGD